MIRVLVGLVAVPLVLVAFLLLAWFIGRVSQRFERTR